jgi:hypothetical protein
MSRVLASPKPYRGAMSRARRSASLAFAAAGLGALAAGCGATYTKQHFIARADAICASALRQTRAITPPPELDVARGQMSELSDYLAAVVPIAHSEVTSLRALRRPSKDNAHDRATLTSYLGAVSQQLSDYDQLASAANRGDPEGVASAEAALRASPAASLAASYGLHECGSPGSTAV